MFGSTRSNARQVATAHSGRAWPLLVLFLGVLSGCGGPRAGAASATAADNNDEQGSLDDERQSPIPPSPPVVDCSDATCFSCGSGLCPQGSYCDQDATGGAACAWLAECSKEPTCGCIVRILGSACECDDSAGPTVSCR